MLNILPYVLAVSRSQIRNNSRSRKNSVFVRTTKANENNINMHYGNLHFFWKRFQGWFNLFLCLNGGASFLKKRLFKQELCGRRGLLPDLRSDVYSHSCQIVPFLSVFFAAEIRDWEGGRKRERKRELYRIKKEERE